MSQTSVLYDLPGPRAIARNRLLGMITIVVLLALFGLLVWRMLDTGQFDASKWEAFGYAAIWQRILGGLLNTLSAFALAAVGALVLGFVLAIGRLSDHAWVRVPVAWITELLRAVPVLVFMMLLYYAMPVIGVRFSPFEAVVIALVAYNGSVLAEVIRAGVESLPRGQQEAGYAVGLRKAGVMRLILLPQAIRAMMPVVISQLVVTLKDTALGFIITYEELLYVAKQLGSTAGLDRPIIQSTIVIGAIYIVICLLLSWFANYLQRRTEASPKVQGPQKPLADDGVTDTQLLLTQRGVDGLPGKAGGQ
ncbi:amino acid ABC transporter permease [Agrococcus sp. ARC_14]|uniref:amino acid ABC transporter permease n=1 Tax=Agrococcus sp. ARC_14 TaxID=2919927 RepID=UPI001F0650D6|nr:amino acid ABC transporter permease [Agrococcus sp. ARC_14]MCH1883588.1 amino acid ABC transporter permease [Agrococcus sp. ARC_14]